MKILMIGFLALFGWSVLSIYIYVCKIKGLCTDPIAMQTNKINDKKIASGLTENMPSAFEQIELPSDLTIYFEFDKFNLDTNAGTDKYFDESNKYLDKNSQAMINITGHTDAVGSEEYNQALGFRRAKSMQLYFVNKGMPANKISINSSGEDDPIQDNASNSGRASNRRTEVTIKK